MLAQFIPLYCVLIAGALGAGLRAMLLAQKLRSDAAAPAEPAAPDETLSPSL